MSDIFEEPSRQDSSRPVDIDRLDIHVSQPTADLDTLTVLKEAENRASEIAAEKLQMLLITIVAAISVLSIAALAIWMLIQGATDADWAKQILGTLLGFAAGALWPLSQANK